MKRFLYLVLLLYIKFGVATISAQPQLREIDVVRLTEAFRLNEAIGNRIWPHRTRIPFAILLVTDTHEFLIRHPHPSPDFRALGYNTRLKSNIYYRERQFSPHLLATMNPIQGSPLPTIVVGQAENTNVYTSSEWVLTLLHEHFHQLQFSHPQYTERINALDLSNGDETGMWALNYAFPYAKPEIQVIFEAMQGHLIRFMEGKGRQNQALVAYKQTRKELKEALSEKDYKYFMLQVWQEGGARYTEMLVAKWAAQHYRPSASFQTLPDYHSFTSVASKMQSMLLEGLKNNRLSTDQRILFYPIGAAEISLISSQNLRWKSKYFNNLFDMDELW